jgi:hypothetical protein
MLRTKKITSTTAIVNNEIAITDSAASRPTGPSVIEAVSGADAFDNAAGLTSRAGIAATFGTGTGAEA